MQLVTDIAPAPAKSAAGVELAGGAQRAITAKPEAYSKTGRRHKPEARHRKRQGKIDAQAAQPHRGPTEGELPPEALLHSGRDAQARRGLTEGQCRPEALLNNGEHRREALPQGRPNEDKLEFDWPPREISHEDVLAFVHLGWTRLSGSGRVSRRAKQRVERAC